MSKNARFAIFVFNSHFLTPNNTRPCPTSASSYLCSTKKKACARSWNKSAACSPARTLTYEVIFIDDGSTDGSLTVLEDLHNTYPEVKVIQFRRNFGKAAAYTAGFQRARGTYIITMDADLQDDPAEIPNLLAKIEEGYDLVSGWKKKRFDPLGKTLPSKFFNWVTGARVGH